MEEPQAKIEIEMTAFLNIPSKLNDEKFRPEADSEHAPTVVFTIAFDKQSERTSIKTLESEMKIWICHAITSIEAFSEGAPGFCAPAAIASCIS